MPSFLLDQFANVPHISDYFGVWSIYEQPFRAFVDQFNSIPDLRQHIADNAEHARSRNSRGGAAASAGVDVDSDGIAIVTISGPTSKAVGSLQEGTSTVRVRQQLRAARRDDSVRGVILGMDTPGGTVKGNRDLADEVAALDAVKPVFAFGEDLVASAGMSVATQARKFYANQASALIGAMGTYSVILDQSRAADRLGVTVHVLRAGEFKGAGTPGTPITADQLAEFQRTVNELNESYLELIARGRGMTVDAVRALADGRIYSATDALAYGLIDGVQTFEATHAELLQLIGSNGGGRSRHSSAAAVDVDDQARNDDSIDQQEKPTMQPATLDELREAFPNASADFILAQLTAKATIVQAATAYAAHVDEHAAAQAAALEQQRQQRSEASNAGLGFDNLDDDGAGHGGRNAETGDAVEDFNELVESIMARRGSSNTLDPKARFAAISIAQRQKPQLYQAYLLATNSGAKRQRQLREKFEEMAEVAAKN